MRTKQLILFLIISTFVAFLTSCSKECDCDCCNQTGSGTGQEQHLIVGKWLCTANTYTITGQGTNNSSTNTIKGWVAIFSADGIAEVPGHASPTTYTINGNTITLGTGTRLNITQLTSNALKYNFSTTSNGVTFTYNCTFSRL